MNFNYKVIDPTGKEVAGQIDAVTNDAAVSSLQRRGFIVVSVVADSQKNILQKSFSFFDKVPMKDVVIMSRQLSALFDAQVSALKAFTLMSEQSDNGMLKFALQTISQDIQGGISISGAMEKHPNVFSNFYVAMVRAGEESGKLTDIRKEQDPEERQKLLTSFNETVQDEYPATFLFSPEFVYSMPTTVEGVDIGPLTTPSERFSSVHTWHREVERVWSIFTR
jgi:type IV pilus assembly protein PilC